ncbi:hypothetical protein FQR65_LT09908 [Abscondita terminalis]|nr:hypothetical protein FQR65_LT09908 [Abscondita terminalis]
MLIMDCCNYMQYKHSYYRPPFYDNGFCNRDYYGHPYQNYYANASYYPHQWPNSTSFSDYVYNPKEARIRKAMREASREQTLGAAPISSPRGGRRSQHWVAAPEEQLLMTPPPELGSPMCSNPIFPGHPTNVGQFMPSMDAYTKLVHVLPPSGWLQDSPTYIQHNPMAELQQHQSHMWHQYQEPIRSCGDSPYLLDAHQSPYQDAGGTDSLPHKKPKSQTNVSTNSRKSDEVVTIKCNSENGAKQEKVDENNTQMSTDSGNSHRNHSYTNICKETIILQNPFDRDDEMKLTKNTLCLIKKSVSKQSTKALPDFNEAFGSTERGRFQSPPDPRLAPNKSYLDCIFFNDTNKFYDYQA